MKKVWDKGRDATCSRTISCPTVHKSHPHNYPFICGVFIISKSVGLHLESFNQKHSLVYLKTPHIGIFMCVWLVDSWTWGHSWTCSIPALMPILFSPVSHPYISLNKKKKNSNVLVCVLFLIAFQWSLEMISLPLPT